ncbi:MAG TPA: immunoglobulin domain-containing protein [Thermoanaerobaculia bacterium]|nr:immunoglobulin domain-containing protein [Thermoanaerobaculia bacterium]
MRLWLAAVLLLLPTFAHAAAELDGAAARASTHSGRSLRWSHTLGGGPNRVLVVGVTTVDNQPLAPNATVTFNGTPVQPVPGGVAVTGDDKGVLRTELFYLLDASLPPAGTYEVAVELERTVSEIGGGSSSLSGLAQAAPEAVAANTSSRTLTTTLTTLTSRAWIVEAAGTDDDNTLAPGAGQPLRYTATGRAAAVAGSAARAASIGTHNLTWSVRAGRIAHVAAAFAPLRFPVTLQSGGHGSIAPAGGLFSDGETVELRAVPDPGYAFVSWSGDVTGTANPAALLVDGPKTITATFDLAVPDFERVVGWATTGNGVTGGQGGAEVVVDTLAKLKEYASRTEPYVIKIYGTIRGNESIRVQSNKSILGIGSDARLLGIGLQIGWSTASPAVRNVIVRNVTFEKPLAPTDAITVQFAKNVWIDHCNFFSDRAHDIDFYDGLLDVTHGADFVTVSWCRFYEHYKTSLVGHSENNAAEDVGHLTVTYHHNSFVNSGGRNPSVRFGTVHIFNNYYRDIDDYAIASRLNAEVLVENNWFENVRRPIRADTSLSDVAGRVRGAETNVYVSSGANSITTPPATWIPAYAYALDPAAIVPESVARWAGVGVVTYTGEKPAPSAPSIVRQPSSQTVDEGKDVAFEVEADGTFPFTYQWLRNGVAIAGATAETLSLKSVTSADAGSYSVQVSNAGGSTTSNAATLAIKFVPPPSTSSFLLRDQFADGARNNQSLPASAAWFTSSGSSNLTVTGSELVQTATSSRTFLAYFTNDQAQPVALNAGESLRLGFTFRFAVFDPATDNFRVGLLRSVANPAAVNGAGFTASGAPNTNARVSGDFGSNGPTSNVFSLYSGYAAFTTVSAAGSPSPVRFLARTGSNATLIGGTGAYTNVPAGTPVAAAPMQAGTQYRGTLTVTRTATGATVSYSVTDPASGASIFSNSATHTGSLTSFDTIAFYLARSSTVNPDLTLSEVSVEKLLP